MHIPEAVLDPRVAAATGVIAGVGLLYATRTVERQLRDRTTVLMGTMSAFVFAAQMVNFPLGTLPISGHLLGGVLASVMLGPWAGAGVIAAVLVVQCLLFGDGGLTALGANFVNMGLIGAVGGYAIYAPLRRLIGGRRGVLLGAMVAAWFSVLMAAGAFALELTAGGRGNFVQVLGWMVLVHSAIGLGEAVITGLVLRYVLQVRPDLIYQPDLPELGAGPKLWQAGLAGLMVAMSVAAFLAPFASGSPDGLEKVGGWLGFLVEADPLVRPLLPDYKFGGIEREGVATALAGLLGTILVFGVGAVMGRAFTRPEQSAGAGALADAS
ncbi:energy-coupling factor ABC transporter permease [Isosphaeraceae bacterium EP7]